MRTLVTTKHISTEKAAKAEGEKGEDGEDRQDLGEDSKKEKDGKSQEFAPLKIQSIGSTEMAIHSPSVQRALRMIIKYYPTQELSRKKIIVTEP